MGGGGGGGGGGVKKVRIFTENLSETGNFSAQKNSGANKGGALRAPPPKNKPAAPQGAARAVKKTSGARPKKTSGGGRDICAPRSGKI